MGCRSDTLSAGSRSLCAAGSWQNGGLLVNAYRRLMNFYDYDPMLPHFYLIDAAPHALGLPVPLTKPGNLTGAR